MKKILYLFTFFTIAMCLFFLPEVYALDDAIFDSDNFDFTEEIKKADAAITEEGGVRVIVVQKNGVRYKKNTKDDFDGYYRVFDFNYKDINKIAIDDHDQKFTINIGDYIFEHIMKGKANTYHYSNRIEVFIYTKESSADGNIGWFNLDESDGLYSYIEDGDYNDGNMGFRIEGLDPCYAAEFDLFATNKLSYADHKYKTQDCSVVIKMKDESIAAGGQMEFNVEINLKLGKKAENLTYDGQYIPWSEHVDGLKALINKEGRSSCCFGSEKF